MSKLNVLCSMVVFSRVESLAVVSGDVLGGKW